jgi:hypothetical protein
MRPSVQPELLLRVLVVLLVWLLVVGGGGLSLLTPVGSSVFGVTGSCARQLVMVVVVAVVVLLPRRSLSNLLEATLVTRTSWGFACWSQLPKQSMSCCCQPSQHANVSTHEINHWDYSYFVLLAAPSVFLEQGTSTISLLLTCLTSILCMAMLQMGEGDS